MHLFSFMKKRFSKTRGKRSKNEKNRGNPRFFRMHLFWSHKLAGVAGFGPTSARVKVWCLTAWLHPKNIRLLYYNIKIKNVKWFFGKNAPQTPKNQEIRLTITQICDKMRKVNAGVAELADALDLGSNTFRCAGSSPVARTKNRIVAFAAIRFFV